MTISDLRIPRHSAMQSRIADLHASAVRLSDDATAAQLKRLSDALLAGARLRWELGVLIVASPSGGVYHVTRAGCDCPNGRKCSARACWHVACFELLLDMLDTEAETADQEVDYYTAKAETELPGYRPRHSAADLGACLARAREALLSGNTGWA